jgi:hypothetical protein
MFNVFDPKSIKRGSVPVQKLPRDEELKLLRALSNPNDHNVPEATRAFAVAALAKLAEETIHMQSWDVYEVTLPGRTERTKHLVGKINHHGEIVATSALVSINTATREAITETDQIYVFGGQVQGSPGVDTKFAWWRDKQGATEVECITAEVRDALLSKKEQR